MYYGTAIVFLADTRPTMLVNGKAFEGTIDYQLTDDQLRACTGNTDLTCLTQFRPVEDFPHARMAYKLLMALHAYNLFFNRNICHGCRRTTRYVCWNEYNHRLERL